MTFKQPAGQGSAHLLGPDMTEHPSHNPAVSNLVSVLCHILNFRASLISLQRDSEEAQARKRWGFVLFFFQHAHSLACNKERKVCKSIQVRQEGTLKASGTPSSPSYQVN